MSSKQNGRIVHLDACRGIAATLVMASHCLGAVDTQKQWDSLRAALGHIPVLFFFVLSGYVLGRPLVRARINLRYWFSYAVKRCFRLIPLLLVVFLFAFYCAQWMNNSRLLESGFSQTMANQATWMAQVKTLDQLVQNLLLIQRGLNVPTWTIKIEIICSILLPIVVAIMAANRFIASFVLVGFCFVGSAFFATLLNLNVSEISFFESLRYMFLFLFGYLLCKIDGVFANGRKWTAMICFIVTVSWLLCASRFHWGDDLTNGVAIALLLAILIPLPFPVFKRFLNNGIAEFFGDMSYGIYLFHTPILLFIICVPTSIWLEAPLGASRFPRLFLVVLIMTLVMSYLTNRLIEIPFNSFGHYLARLISPNQLREKSSKNI